MGALEDILNEESGVSPEDQTNKVLEPKESPIEDNSSFVEAKTLEVAGMIRDDYGNEWQVPGDNVQDLDDLYAGDVYKIPDSLSAKFFVQMIRVDELKEYMLRKFVPVLQEELEIPKSMIKDMGNPLDRYHVVGDAIMVKIPHEIRNRLEDRKVRTVKRRLMDLEPTAEMMKKAGIDSGMMVEHKICFNIQDPRQREGIFVDESGNRK